MHHLVAHTGCPDGPCPDLTVDTERGKTGGQGYIPEQRTLARDLPATPAGEVRWEMDTATFEHLLAQYLTDDAVERIQAKRATLRAVV